MPPNLDDLLNRYTQGYRRRHPINNTQQFPSYVLNGGIDDSFDRFRGEHMREMGTEHDELLALTDRHPRWTQYGQHTAGGGGRRVRDRQGYGYVGDEEDEDVYPVHGRRRRGRRPRRHQGGGGSGHRREGGGQGDGYGQAGRRGGSDPFETRVLTRAREMMAEQELDANEYSQRRIGLPLQGGMRRDRTGEGIPMFNDSVDNRGDGGGDGRHGGGGDEACGSCEDCRGHHGDDRCADQPYEGPGQIQGNWAWGGGQGGRQGPGHAEKPLSGMGGSHGGQGENGGGAWGPGGYGGGGFGGGRYGGF